MAQQGLVLNVGNLGSQTAALKTALGQFPGNVQKRVGRSAVTKATRPVAKSLKGLAKSDSANSRWNAGTGQLARAVGIKTGTQRDGDPFGIAGVRKGANWRATFLLPSGRRKRAFNLASKAKRRPSTGKRVIRWPQKYFHLVSKGFRHYRGPVFPGRSLMIRAWQRTKVLSRRILVQAVSEGIGREAAKIRVRTAFKGRR